MSRPKMSAQPRQVQGKAVSKLRRQGLLPAVVYGNRRESQPIQLDLHEFELLRRHSGRNAMVDLQLDGGRPQPVLVQSIQEHPVTRRPLHVDLLAVNMREERTVDVPIVTSGSSVAVDRMGGILLHLRDTVQVRALPDDLPSSVSIDITPLESFDVVLHASDLQIPTGVTLVTDGEEPVARVQPPRVEEPAAEAAEEAEEAAVPEGAEEGAEQPASEATEGAERTAG